MGTPDTITPQTPEFDGGNKFKRLYKMVCIIFLIVVGTIVLVMFLAADGYRSGQQQKVPSSTVDAKVEILRKASLVFSGGDPDTQLTIDDRYQVIYAEQISSGEKTTIVGPLIIENPDNTWTVLNPNGSVFITNSYEEAESKQIPRDSTLPLPETTIVKNAEEASDSELEEVKYFTTKDGQRVLAHALPSGVDHDTFQLIKGDKDEVGDFYNILFSRDKSHIYYYQMIIPVIDTMTFVPLNEVYSKDNSQVYFRNKTVEGADASTFIPLGLIPCGGGYAKDRNHVYKDDQILEGKDPDTFVMPDYSNMIFEC